MEAIRLPGIPAHVSWTVFDDPWECVLLFATGPSDSGDSHVKGVFGQRQFSRPAQLAALGQDECGAVPTFFLDPSCQ